MYAVGKHKESIKLQTFIFYPEKDIYSSVPVAFWEGKRDVDDSGRSNIINTDIIMHEKDSCNKKNIHIHIRKLHQNIFLCNNCSI